jgi:hypothetical protein
MEKNYFTTRFARLVTVLNKLKVPSKVALLVVGFASTIWFLFRVIPKPSRASYPCMRAAAPLASSFVIYLIGITSFTFLFKKVRQQFYESRYKLAAVMAIAGLVMGAWTVYHTNASASASDNTPQVPQTGNEPVGEGKGIFPGRVVWVHNPAVTDENCENLAGSNDYWYMETNTDQNLVNNMVSSSIQQLTGTDTDEAAWDSIFTYHNRSKGNGNVSYAAGEKIVIKLNLNAIGNGPNCINTSPQICYSILNQLVNVVGVAETDISIGDPNCSMNTVTYNKIHNAFPGVICWGNSGGLTPPPATASSVLFASDGSYEDVLPQSYIDAAYMINIPVLKKHHRAGISLSSKNHFGSIARYTSGAWHLHPSLPCPETSNVTNGDYGVYRCFVDIMGHEDLGGKTVLYLIDGLWGSVNWGHPAVKWRMTPFNNDWPSSVFTSIDPVAIESVGYDFLYQEFDPEHPTEGGAFSDAKGPFSRMQGADDFLHQAASSANWPAGLDYDPENDGSILGSLGVHEHWNNPIDKEYTRDLLTGNGIELVKILAGGQITSDNSDLLSNKVTTIFVDSFDVKWFGTDQGISRYNNSTWTDITTADHLLNNNVRDIEYEKSGYGDEIWIATAGGLSVISYDVDGVTGSTTYTSGNSGLISDDVSIIGVDTRHNRWAGTPAGLSVFRGSAWADTTFYMDENHQWESFVGTNIYDAAGNDTMLIASDSGVIKYTYDLIDGFTGASAYGKDWSRLDDYKVNSVAIFNYVQWYGTPLGAYIHRGNDPKSNWQEPLTMDSGLVSNNVRVIEMDNEGNIWFGTDKGISIKTSEGWFQYPTGMQASNLSFDNSTAFEEVDIHWNNGTGVAEGSGLINGIVNDIKKDFSGNVWVATDDGIEYFSYVPGTRADLLNARRAVFVKEGNTGTVAPVNNTTYTANSEYGLGANVDGWYCVYNGKIDSVYVTGLVLNTTYRIMVVEYSGVNGSEIYVTSESTGNPANFTTGGVDVVEVPISESLSVYPNPFNNYIVIKGEKLNAGSVASFYSIDGRMRFRTVLNNNSEQINTSDFEAGTYILQIIDGDKNYSVKIIK